MTNPSEGLAVYLFERTYKDVKWESVGEEWPIKAEYRRHATEAMRWLLEDVLTRERIAVMIYDRMPHDTAWSFAAWSSALPTNRKFCLNVADAIRALFADPERSEGI